MLKKSGLFILFALMVLMGERSLLFSQKLVDESISDSRTRAVVSDPVDSPGAAESVTGQRQNANDVIEAQFELYRKSQNFDELQKSLDLFLLENRNLFCTASHAVLLYKSALVLENQGKPAKAYRYLRAAILTDLKIVGSIDNDFIKGIFSWVERHGNKDERQFQRLFAFFVDGDMDAVHKCLPELEASVTDAEIKNDMQLVKRATAVMHEKKAALEKAEIESLKTSKSDQDLLENQSIDFETIADYQWAMHGKPVDEAGRNSEIARIRARLQEKQFDNFANLTGGSQLFALGDLEGSRSAFEKVLQLKPDLPEGNIRLARVFKAQGKLTEAMMCAQRAVAANPGNADFRGLCSLLFAEQGDFARAEAEARAVIAVNSLNAEARLALALCYVNAEDIENALNHIEIGIKANDSRFLEQLTSLKIRITPINKPR